MCHRTPLANEHLNQYALLVLSCGSIVIFFSPSMNALVLDVAVLLQAASIGPSRHFQDRTAAAFWGWYVNQFFHILLISLLPQSSSSFGVDVCACLLWLAPRPLAQASRCYS